MGIDISPMPVRHGQTPARRLHLPESEPLWRAGRGFGIAVGVGGVGGVPPWVVSESLCLGRVIGFCPFAPPCPPPGSFIGNYADLRGNPLFPAIARLRAAVARRHLWISPMFAGIA
jgi:hypothetical protein